MIAAATHPRTWMRGVLLAAALASLAAAQDAQSEIRAALTQWMDDFNAGRADKVCGLFAPDLVAQFRGQPERDYNGLCDLLKRSLGDRERAYNYALAIKEIIVIGEFAVVRLVWTLKVQRKDAPGGDITADEPGMDLFRRQPDGSWKIARYIAYEDGH
jgi:ketosteroid isomerase-like protein